MCCRSKRHRVLSADSDSRMFKQDLRGMSVESQYFLFIKYQMVQSIVASLSLG